VRSLTAYFSVLLTVNAASPPAAPIRVLIADDHPLFVKALEAILVTDERIRVVGHARDGREAIDLSRTLGPEIVLMDISMPILDGIEATRRLTEEGSPARVLVVSGSNSRHDVDRAREAGAAGYLTKDRIAAELIDAIVDVAGRSLS
jgi:two-component system, NarL family, nitrate/nitrite response regulator NarL